MTTRDVTIAVVGSGGDGVMTLGDLLAQAAAKEGLHVMKTEAYGPQIRGGESSCAVRVAADAISAPGDAVDVLVVFRWADFARFRGEIAVAPDALVLYEATDERPSGEHLGLAGDGNVTWIPVPLAELSRSVLRNAGLHQRRDPGHPRRAPGAPARDPQARARAPVRPQEGSRARRQRPRVRRRPRVRGLGGRGLSGRRLEYTPSAPRLLMSGNEAVAIGALHAGCRFFAGYPITPSSEILHFLAEWMPRAGGSLLQTEDELAAIGAVIGALVRGREVDDRHLRPRPLADDRDAGSRLDGRGAGRHRRRPARRAFDRATRPRASSPTCSRRSSGPTATRPGSCSPAPTSRTASTRRSRPSTSPRSSRSRSSSCPTRPSRSARRRSRPGRSSTRCATG